MKKPITLEDQMNEIMDWFDFSRVRRMMAAVGWKWGSSNTSPEVGELRASARTLMKCAIECQGISSTGGFTALVDDAESGAGKTAKRLTLYWGESWECDPWGDE